MSLPARSLPPLYPLGLCLSLSWGLPGLGLPTWAFQSLLGGGSGRHVSSPGAQLWEVGNGALRLGPGWGWVVAEAEVKVHSEPFLQGPLELKVSEGEGKFGGGACRAGLAG